MEETFPLMSALPVCVAFMSKGSGNSLCYEPTAGKVVEQIGGHGDATADEPSPYTVFRIEASGKHGGLVHVRCCLNNKYWAPQPDGCGGWTIVAVDEPDEDLSKPSCTLFKLVPVADDSIRLLHSQLGKYACLDMANHYLHIVTGDGEEDDDSSISSVLVYSSVTNRLPSKVVFKGSNDRYLSARVISRRNHLQFSPSDIGDPTITHTVEQQANGDVFIRSDHFGGRPYWRRIPDDGDLSYMDMYWVVADHSGDASRVADTRFRVVGLGLGEVALRNVASDNFCGRFTSGRQTTDVLCAGEKHISSDDVLRPGEPVISREITVLRYLTDQARLHNVGVETMRTVTVNGTSNDIAVSMTQTQTRSTASSWSSTLSTKVGVSVKFTVGIPVIGVGGSIEVSTQQEKSYNWGESVTETRKDTAAFDATVAPGRTVTATLVSSRASSDVPFVYRQRDVLTTGEVMDNSNMQDGICTITNSYDAHFRASEVA